MKRENQDDAQLKEAKMTTAGRERLLRHDTTSRANRPQMLIQRMELKHQANLMSFDMQNSSLQRVKLTAL